MMSVAAAAIRERRRAPKFSMLLAVLGVVYGDIGTSPLYAFKASLSMFKDVRVSDTEIMGILSLIFWSLILIVTVKYVMLVMRADNRGEGGVLAMMALAQRVCPNSGRAMLLCS
jgi:KUP system potassium uptake protein